MTTTVVDMAAATDVADTESEATEVAVPDFSQATKVAERLTPGIVQLCIQVADEILTAAQNAGTRENTRQDRLLTRLEVYRIMKQVIDERQLKLLNQGREIGVKNPAMATALGLRSGEAVRKKLPPKPPGGGVATEVAE